MSETTPSASSPFARQLGLGGGGQRDRGRRNLHQSLPAGPVAPDRLSLVRSIVWAPPVAHRPHEPSTAASDAQSRAVEVSRLTRRPIRSKPPQTRLAPVLAAPR